jgi:hypothetical protein
MNMLNVVCTVEHRYIKKKIIHILQVLSPFETLLLHSVSVFYVLAEFNELIIECRHTF